MGRAIHSWSLFMCILKHKWYPWLWAALRAKATTVKCLIKLSHQNPLLPFLFGCQQSGCRRTDFLLQSIQHVNRQAPLRSYRPGQHKEVKIAKHNRIIKAFNIAPPSYLAQLQATWKCQRMSQTQTFPPLPPAQHSHFLRSVTASKWQVLHKPISRPVINPQLFIVTSVCEPPVPIPASYTPTALPPGAFIFYLFSPLLQSPSEQIKSCAFILFNTAWTLPFPQQLACSPGLWKVPILNQR